MKRYCFQLQVKPDRIEEYVEAHAAVWPEMVAGARATPAGTTTRSSCGGTACSSATSRATTWPRPRRAMAATEVNARWQAAMGGFFEDLDVPPDEGFLLLEEVFHLEDQLPATHPASTARLARPQLDLQDEGSVMTVFADIATALEGLAIEVPSWAYGNSGTRFKVFGSPGTPRTVQEKIADAATVHRFTGLAPTVALHIPWDHVDDYAALRAYAKEHGVALGTINSNTFQDDDYKLGSLTNADPRGPSQGGRPQPRVHRGDEPDRLPRPQDLARRRHQLPRPGRHPRPPGLAGRGPRGDLRPAVRGPATGPGVQVLRAGVLPHRRPGLGYVVRPLHRPRRAGPGLPGHRSPRAGHQHRVHRGAAAAPGQARARSTSTAASTPTTTSSSVRPTRSSCSGSWSRSSGAAASDPTATSR